MLMYLLFPGNLFGLLYEFNPEAFAPLFIVLMFRALHKRDLRRMMFWAVFLMLIKENMVLIAAAFGVRALFVAGKGERKKLIIFTIACAAVFISLVVFLIPYFRGLEQHAFTVRYAKLGNNVQDILLTPVRHPLWLYKVITMPVNLKFLGDLFSYLLIPALCSPLALLMMLPLLLQHMCSSSMSEHTIFYHYAPTMIPFIFFAFMETLAKIKGIRMLEKGAFPLVIFLLVVSLPVLFTYRKAMAGRWLVLEPSQASEVWKMIKEIPADAPVIATFRFLAPLSTRPEVYSFHKLYSDDFNDPQKMGKSELNTDKSFTLSERVSYALVDLDDPWYLKTIRSGKESEMERIRAFFSDPDWKVIKKVDRMVLLKRVVSSR